MDNTPLSLENWSVVRSPFISVTPTNANCSDQISSRVACRAATSGPMWEINSCTSNLVSTSTASSMVNDIRGLGHRCYRCIYIYPYHAITPSTMVTALAVHIGLDIIKTRGFLHHLQIRSRPQQRPAILSQLQRRLVQLDHFVLIKLVRSLSHVARATKSIPSLHQFCAEVRNTFAFVISQPPDGFLHIDFLHRYLDTVHRDSPMDNSDLDDESDSSGDGNSHSD